jgi:4-hydroxy-3-polyprenylbenzoate decarboxylase
LRVIVGITGASGAIYGVGLLALLHKLGHEVHVTVTGNGLAVLRHECGVSADLLSRFGRVYASDDLFAPIASGSFPVDCMAVAPCSANTLGKIATGIGDNLLTRAASIALKERRRLVLLVREMPLSTIHVENMAALSREGVVIAPPVPGFYSRPRTMADVVAQSVGRTLDLLGVDADVAPRWGVSIDAEEPAPAADTEAVISDLLARL